jgi:hypothetical protein
VPVPESVGVTLRDVMGVAAEANGAGAKASGICGDREILVISAKAGVAHLVLFVGAGWPGAACIFVIWTIRRVRPLAGTLGLVATGPGPGLLRFVLACG